MRRWLIPLLIVLVMAPIVALATGTLTIPNNIGAQPTGNLAASLLDANWTAIATYVNAREITQDVAANRPVAGTKGRWYFSTDANGGTLYNDSGSAWVQVAAPVTNSLADQYTGLTLSLPTDSVTLGIAVGAATSDDATITNRVLMILSSAFTKKLSATWTVGTGNGCLDSGTIAASTQYHSFLITRLDTNVVDILCSTSATAPTMPTNYTKKRRIGSFFTDANAAIAPFTQRGVHYFMYATPSGFNVNQTNPGSPAAAVTASAAAPNGVVAQAILNVLLLNAATASAGCYISALTEADMAPATAASPLETTGSGAVGASGVGQVVVWTNTSQQFRFRCTATAAGDILRITTLGYYDPLTP